jgi:cytochrome c oxidase cbb3-type subunit III
MSDFVSSFWGIAISVATILGIVACLALLIISGRTQSSQSSDGSTGHIWDEDLREMNNPLPFWWVGLFLITILFSVGYLVLYPGLGTAAGLLGWSSVKQHTDEGIELEKRIAPLYARFAKLSHEDLIKTPEAMAAGQSIFLNQCAQCHGSDGRGSRGFPNLTDKDWLHGGTAEAITATIKQGRQGMMPPLAAALGDANDVANVAHYVLSLSNSAHDAAKAALGKPKFGVCAACHGANGEGNQALGAPNLSDKIWLHGQGEAAITNIIVNGRVNAMPAQEQKLNEDQIRVITAYVMKLGQ